ncbi:MAG: Lpp/OprI family alanine-zipper lipoprotein [Oceanicoccus sp.]
MKGFLKMLSVASVVVVASGCANTAQMDEMKALAEQAQSTAAMASEAAASAQSTADRALAAASSAQSSADAAQSSADDANEKVDRAFKKAMEK